PAKTNAAGAYVIRAHVRVPGRYRAASTRATSPAISLRVALPRLTLGARSPVVGQLGNSLHRLHYAAPYGTSFDGRMLDAVYAFEKVQGLPRTGVVDARDWRALGSARTPSPRYVQPANHLEVNKGRQVLYVVRRSRVPLL